MKKPSDYPQKPSQHLTQALAQVGSFEELEGYVMALSEQVRGNMKKLSSKKKKKGERDLKLTASIREGRSLIYSINNIINRLRSSNE